MSAKPWNEHRKYFEASTQPYFERPIMPSWVQCPRVGGSSGASRASAASGLGSPPRSHDSFNSPSSTLSAETRASLQRRDKNYLRSLTLDTHRAEWSFGSTAIFQSDSRSNVPRNFTMGTGLPSMGTLSSGLPPLPPSRSLTSYQLPMLPDLKRQHDKARREAKQVSRTRRASPPCGDSQPLVTGFTFSHATSIVNLPTCITSTVPLTFMGEDIYVHTGQQTGMHPASPIAGYVGASYQKGGNITTMQSRPKPQCWLHGCNGRHFSTFSNLLRHQREKSKLIVMAQCCKCGKGFTRTTARDRHMDYGICAGY